ncbi:hypothetical protein AAG570_003549 [Ranatra chinensis]|uniref:2-oxoacid dehydrogenase acyltransferase catalytic domain-containing protein n=1 Tax=Ranatra chinensis TaxID=642074 RepID=A0ABD0YSH9_9HEMI
MAKALAEKKQIRLEGKGSGLYGSIKASDLEGVAPSAAPAQAGSRVPHAMPPPPPGTRFTDLPLSNIRSVIAKRLTMSKQTIPHYYLTMDVCIDELMNMRKDLNHSLEKSGVKLSVNDFIIKATSLASMAVPEANSAWMDKFIREYHSVDVSVAVSTEKGLFTPIIFEANKKGLSQISTEMKALAKKAREGKLAPQEFQGGTISISNLGMFNITNFCAVINPPQSCILAIGGLQTRMVPVKSTSGPGFKSSNFISVTLSCDHRVVDGAVGARWLQVFKDLIETPCKMLL